MAEELKDYSWNRGRPPEGNYNWEKWTNGSTWRLTAPEDFTCKASTFQVKLRRQANKMPGYGVHTSVKGDKEIVFQFYQLEEEELYQQILEEAEFLLVLKRYFAEQEDQDHDICRMWAGDVEAYLRLNPDGNVERFLFQNKVLEDLERKEA